MIVVNMDYNIAKVVVGIIENKANGARVIEELDAKQARSIAIRLLNLANEAEEQAALNEKRRVI